MEIKEPIEKTIENLTIRTDWKLMPTNDRLNSIATNLTIAYIKDTQGYSNADDIAYVLELLQEMFEVQIDEETVTTVIETYTEGKEKNE